MNYDPPRGAFVDAIDTFFNGRPSPNNRELERLRAENGVLRNMIKISHEGRAPRCLCWVCVGRSNARG